MPQGQPAVLGQDAPYQPPGMVFDVPEPNELGHAMTGGNMVFSGNVVGSGQDMVDAGSRWFAYRRSTTTNTKSSRISTST